MIHKVDLTKKSRTLFDWDETGYINVLMGADYETFVGSRKMDLGV